MSVRNIDLFHSGKSIPDNPHLLLFPHHPYPMGDPVRGSEIIQGFPCRHPVDHLPQRSLAAISQKDGARLGLADIHMADSVLLLVRPGILMFLNHLILIIINGGAGHYAFLAPPLHNLFIDIIAGLVLPDKTAFPNPLPQQIVGFLIDAVRIGIHLRSKLRLCAVNG